MNDDAAPARTPPADDVETTLERAREAERRIGELESKLAETEASLAEARQTVDSVERRRQIDLALMDADAVDLESARLLTEVAIEGMDEPDVAKAVRELRERKPFLFKRRAGGIRASSQSPHAPGAQTDPLTGAAEDAARTGDRRALLRYLQLKRGA